MKKLKLLSLVGITSIALANAGWAAGHGGGGGGFGGGGFSGGGGGRAGGGGARGGFVGAPHFAGGTAHFGGPRFAGRNSMSRIRPHTFAGPDRGTINRTAASNVARNRGAMASAARPARTMPQRGLNGRTDHIAERHEANWHGDWDRRHAHFDHGHFFVFFGGFWFGLDDGFFPWDYLPYYADDYYPYDYYTD